MNFIESRTIEHTECRKQKCPGLPHNNEDVTLHWNTMCKCMVLCADNRYLSITLARAFRTWKMRRKTLEQIHSGSTTNTYSFDIR